MCRYAGVRYKPHHACFSCRKMFKRRRRDDVNPQGQDRLARCPQCGHETADMGLDFRPPKRTDVRGWLAAEMLFLAGVTFHGCGCGGPGYRPADPRAVEDFVRPHRDHAIEAFRAELRGART